MKNTGIVCRIISILLAVILLAVPVSATTATEDMSIINGCHTIDAQVPMLIDSDEQITNVYSAFLYDYTNETLIYALNPDVQYAPASLVKIMTGLIVAEQATMTDQVTVRQEVLDTLPYNSMGIGLQAGEIISMEDLFYGILVESANDAAAVAADHISGSQTAFIQQMNDYAAQIGCTNTHFTNVHGLHEEEQFSTARDLARILSVAAKNELFMMAFGTVNYTIPATNMSEPRPLSSSNYLMNDDIMTVYLDSRVTGGRSGVMDTGERNLAVTAEKNGVKLVSVVIGSLSELAPNGHSVITFGSFQETSKLLDMGFRGHRSVQLFYDNQALKQYNVINGDSYVSTGVKDSFSVLLPAGINHEDLTYLYNEDETIIRAPVTKGDAIATVQVWHENVCFAQADLYALHDVGEKQVVQTEEIQEETSSGIPSVLIVVAVIVGLLFVLLFGRRLLFKIIRMNRIRRHRKNRRRSR